MLLPSPSTDEKSPATQRAGDFSPLVNESANQNGYEAQWLHNRTEAQRFPDSHPISTVVLPTRKPGCVTANQISDGQEAIAMLDSADMAGLCRGDDDAMTRLIHRHAPSLRRVIARMLKDENEAADVVEETFVRVHIHRERFDRRAKFSSWLYTIALNQARNRLRSRARQPEFVPLDELTEEELEAEPLLFAREPAPDAHLEELETACWLGASFAALPAQLREPLELFACDDCSQAELAARFNCSVKAIESRLYHARKQLRAEFDRFLHPCALMLCNFASPFNHQHKIENQT